MWDYSILNKSITISKSNNMYQTRSAAPRKPKPMKLCNYANDVQLLLIQWQFWVTGWVVELNLYKATYRSVSDFTSTLQLKRSIENPSRTHAHMIDQFNYVYNQMAVGRYRSPSRLKTLSENLCVDCYFIRKLRCMYASALLSSRPLITYLATSVNCRKPVARYVIRGPIAVFAIARARALRITITMLKHAVM